MSFHISYENILNMIFINRKLNKVLKREDFVQILKPSLECLEVYNVNVRMSDRYALYTSYMLWFRCPIGTNELTSDSRREHVDRPVVTAGLGSRVSGLDGVRSGHGSLHFMTTVKLL